jgi:hypothetical protein
MTLIVGFMKMSRFIQQLLVQIHEYDAINLSFSVMLSKLTNALNMDSQNKIPSRITIPRNELILPSVMRTFLG